MVGAKTARTKRGLVTAVWVVLLMPRMTACTGIMSDVAGPGGSDSSSEDPIGGTRDDPWSPGGSQGGDTPDGLVPGDTPNDPRIAARIWRLTPEQLNDQVRQLFGDGAPQFDIPESAPVAGITNIAGNAVVDLGNATLFVDGARAIGNWVKEHGPTATRCADYGSDACIESFLDWFVRGAFRRPVSDEERSELRALAGDLRSEYDYDYAIAGLVRAVLLSPDFLYRTELGSGGALDAYEIANLLAFAITDQAPDAELIDAAARDALADPDEREAQARRLMKRSDRAWQRLFGEWLALDTLRSQGAEVGLSSALVGQMETEYRTFLRNVIVEQDGTLRELMTAPYTWAEPELAAHYGASHPGAGVARVELDPAQRGGLLTQGAWLVSHGKDGRDNVVRRGMNLFKQGMCNNELAPPPNIDVNAELDKLISPDASVREIVDARDAAPTCGACHRAADPMGLVFESFASDGRYQTSYPDGAPVDTAGSIDALGAFDDAVELSSALADDESFQSCFVRRATQFFVGIDVGPPASAAWVREAYDTFVAKGTSLEELVVAIVRHPAFIERPEEPSP